ncbi:MAG: DUF1365 domain-containing protein [Notoacmeibacter sp.]
MGELKTSGSISGNGRVPNAAVCLYRADVMHARLKPFGHRFNYKVFNILIDVTNLKNVAKSAALFSVNTFNLLSFHEKDHMDVNAVSLKNYVQDLLAKAQLAEQPERILLLCYPRLLGFVFNPISVYFCYNQSETLVACIYEVRNTFGQRHTYVAKIEQGELSDAGLRQKRTKLFHVSPFVGMEAAYHFRVLPPGDKVRVRILETENDEPLLSATIVGNQKPFNSWSILTECVRAPLMTLKVVAGIHYEALKLWLKGARYHTVPPAPISVSYTDTALKPASKP